MSNVHPAGTVQTTSPFAARIRCWTNSPSLPHRCDPGTTRSGPFSAPKSSRWTRTVTICSSTQSGPGHAARPP